MAEGVDLRAWLAEHPLKETKNESLILTAGGNPKRKGRPPRESDQERKIRRATEWINQKPGAQEGTGDHGGHRSTIHAACGLIKDFGLTVDEARPIFYAWNQSCSPPWSESELEHKLQQADEMPDSRPRGWKLEEGVRRVSGPPRGPAPQDPDNPRDDQLPEVLIDYEEWRTIDAAIHALSGEENVFQRPNGLVTVLRDPGIASGVVRPAGSPRITALSHARLRDMLTQVADWRKMKANEEGEWDAVKAHPPIWAVNGVLSRGYWEDIPQLDSITESPVLRNDWTILNTPGYDDRTFLLYEPNAEFPEVPSQPSKEDALEALGELFEIVCDFPFASDVHRSAWLAGLLTPFARYAYVGPSPLFLFDANTAGSGKSLLCDLIAVIVSGRPMPRSAYPDSDEEMRKRITSIALSGDRLVLLDNIVNGFGGPSLDAVLTSITWKDRILGRSEMSGDMTLFTVWYGTGNNIFFRGDAHRRVIPCRLVSSEENPQDREIFSHPRILDWATQNRGKLASMCLTLLRAYYVAGKPKVCSSPLGSYEGWSDIVRSTVLWLTENDPVDTQTEYRRSDPDTNFREAVVNGWAEVHDSQGMDKDPRGMTAAHALSLLSGSPHKYTALRDALMTLSRDEDLPGPKIVGRRLSELRERAIRGRDCKIRMMSTPHVGTMLWRVERLDGQLATLDDTLISDPESDVSDLFRSSGDNSAPF